jgi:L-histidine N-alpha-methyltransferase
LIERWLDPQSADTLARDVRHGLLSNPKWLPSKHLYDELGGRLFEEICDLPEYYPTRTELALLEEVSAQVVDMVRPQCLVELGSGSSRKSRVLLDAMAPQSDGFVYLPIDINETAVRESSTVLLERFPTLAVRGFIADFERALPRLPRGAGVLAAFLGGTLGNFEAGQGGQLLARLANALGQGAWLLLGTDMVKDRSRLLAAYDDRQGVTARFNLNMLEVVNRRLDARFRLADFAHQVLYDSASDQIEMHLRARCPQTVRIGKLDLSIGFETGETVRTEVSRKFTPQSGRRMLEEAGFLVRERFAPSSGDFSLWLAEVAPTAR